MKVFPIPSRAMVIAMLLSFLPFSGTFAQYCTPSFFQGCVITGMIDNFELGGTSGILISDPATGCNSGAYRDYSAVSATLNAGTTYTITATCPGAGTGIPSHVQIFIDFDNNFSLSDPGETVGGGSFTSSAAETFVITIPTTAPSGPHRLRMVSIGEESYPTINPCPVSALAGGVAVSGEVHDYTVNIISSTPPPSPCASVTGLTVSAITSGSATLNWTAASGATGYEWAVTTSPAPPTSGTLTSFTTASASSLAAATTYYAHVRTKCGSSYSGWVTSSVFTTLPGTSTTCNPVTGLTISGITSGSANLNWTAVSGAVGYEWVVSTSTTPPSSGTFTSLTTATASSLSPTTVYYAHVRTKCSATLFSTWVSVPFTTLATPTCPAITGLSASSVTTAGATISWTAITSGSLGYQYVINNTITTPLTSGTNTTATSTSPSGLTAATTYYAHVRDSCGVGDFSPWSTIPFTTLAAAGGCNAVTGLSVSGVTTAAASLSWTMASGAVAAKWVVDNNPADPTVSGTLSTTSSAAVSGLTASTLYYAHVRDTCGPTSLSAWVTIPFTTLSGTTGIAELNTGNAPFSIAVHPNPVNSTLHIQVSGIISSSATVTLADVTGHIIRHINITNVNSDIDMGSLPQGIYLVRYSDAGYTQTLRVTKQ